MPALGSKQNTLNILEATEFKKFGWLVHGFSTRAGGSSRLYGGNALNLGFTKDDARAAVERNRLAFLRTLGAGEMKSTRPAAGRKSRAAGGRFQPWPLITLRQIHSDIIHHVDAPPEAQLAGDGLITQAPKLLLAVQTADCLPVVLVDTRQRAVGVFHAGWRGTLRRIVEKGAGEMKRWFNTRAQDLKAAIGPGIHGCCYEVGEEVREKFESQFAYAASLFREVKERDPVREKYPMMFMNMRAPGHGELPNKIFLDLVEANRRQLLAAGVKAKNIEASAMCTSCHPDLLFSYRKQNGKTGRMMAVAGIRGR